jgi:methanogenic corrinoid protein MtbC1
MLHIVQELADPSRRFILMQLLEGPKNVSTLCDATGLKQPNVSNHLSKLLERGIVHRSKSGREAYYSLSSEEVIDALVAVKPVEKSAEKVDLGEEAKRFADCAVKGMESECLSQFEMLLRRRVPIIDLYEQVLTSALYGVGDMYAHKKIDEAQEHLASEIARRAMARTMHAYRLPPSNGPLAVLGCVPGELHSIGIRMVADALRSQGWRTLHLGGSVPEASFVRQVQDTMPTLALLSVSMPENIPSALSLVNALCKVRSSGEYRVEIGGRVVSKYKKQLTMAGADHVHTSLASFAERVRAAYLS